MADIVAFCLQLALNIALPWAIVRWDERRLDAWQLARAWNDASRWAAVVVFGPLCLPFHFAKTRRSRLVGVALGLLALMVALLVSGVVASLADAVLGHE